MSRTAVYVLCECMIFWHRRRRSCGKQHCRMVSCDTTSPDHPRRKLFALPSIVCLFACVTPGGFRYLLPEGERRLVHCCRICMYVCSRCSCDMTPPRFLKGICVHLRLREVRPAQQQQQHAVSQPLVASHPFPSLGDFTPLECPQRRFHRPSLLGTLATSCHLGFLVVGVICGDFYMYRFFFLPCR